MNPSRVIEEMVVERQLWIHATKEFRDLEIHKVASRMAKSDKSDPFTYNRVFAHLKNNIKVPRDFKH